MIRAYELIKEQVKRLKWLDTVSTTFAGKISKYAVGRMERAGFYMHHAEFIESRSELLVTRMVKSVTREGGVVALSDVTVIKSIVRDINNRKNQEIRRASNKVITTTIELTKDGHRELKARTRENNCSQSLLVEQLLLKSGKTFEQINTRLKEKTELNRRLRDDLSSLSKEVDTLRKELHESKSSNIESEKEIKRLREELNSLKTPETDIDKDQKAFVMSADGNDTLEQAESKDTGERNDAPIRRQYSHNVTDEASTAVENESSGQSICPYDEALGRPSSSAKRLERKKGLRDWQSNFSHEYDDPSTKE